MKFPVTNVVLLASLSSIVVAQFGFFDQMFGNHQSQQQRHQQPPQADSQWIAHADSVSCSLYLCPGSLVCVTRPLDCPCPRAEDIKCVVPDAEDTEGGTVVCVSGASGCTAVERLLVRVHPE